MKVLNCFRVWARCRCVPDEPFTPRAPKYDGYSAQWEQYISHNDVRAIARNRLQLPFLRIFNAASPIIPLFRDIGCVFHGLAFVVRQRETGRVHEK